MTLKDAGGTHLPSVLGLRPAHLLFGLAQRSTRLTWSALMEQLSRPSRPAGLSVIRGSLALCTTQRVPSAPRVSNHTCTFPCASRPGVPQSAKMSRALQPLLEWWVGRWANGAKLVLTSLTCRVQAWVEEGEPGQLLESPQVTPGQQHQKKMKQRKALTAETKPVPHSQHLRDGIRGGSSAGRPADSLAAAGLSPLCERRYGLVKSDPEKSELHLSWACVLPLTFACFS